MTTARVIQGTALSSAAEESTVPTYRRPTEAQIYPKDPGHGVFGMVASTPGRPDESSSRGYLTRFGTIIPECSC